MSPHITEHRIDDDGLWIKVKGYWYQISDTQPGPLRDGFVVAVPERSDAPIFFALVFYDDGGFEIREDFCANPDIVREAFALLADYWHPDAAEELRRILNSDPPAWRWAKEFPISLECPKYFHNANLYKDSVRRHHA